MKRLLLLVLAFFLLSSAKVSADEGWQIDNFASDIAIQKTGEVVVTEKIDVDFDALSKHGIYRDIPYLYKDGENETYTRVDVKQVLQNNNPAHYSASQEKGNIELKIGDSNKTISGKNSYIITYAVSGVLRSFSDHDELYWNVTGNNWPVSIQKSQAHLSLPTDGIQKINCFTGALGATNECQSSSTAKTAHFATTTPLSAYEGMSVVVGYQKGLVPILTVEHPKTFFEKLFSTSSDITLSIVLLSGLATIFALWFTFGRDYWTPANVLEVPSGEHDTKPIGAHETTVVEFTPPEKLTPAEIGVLLDERADTLDVVSTIVDLAARGYLTITEVPKKWMFGKNDYKLTKLNNSKSKQKLLDYEEFLLDKLFDTGDTISVSDLKTTFYKDLKTVKEKLYEDLTEKKIFAENPEKIRLKYLAYSVLLVAFGTGLVWLSLVFDLIYLADVGIGAGISGILFVIVSQVMPRRTAYGRNLFRRAKGYALFIKTAEKYRQQFFENKNLFNDVLPYAIVLGQTQKFAQAMKEIGLKNPSTGWYIGAQPFQTQAFASSMNDFSSSMSTAIASAPSSGGFSGGSSGGGFGGGGGGSW